MMHLQEPRQSKLMTRRRDRQIQAREEKLHNTQGSDKERNIGKVETRERRAANSAANWLFND